MKIIDICCYILSFAKSGTHDSGYLQYLLFINGYPSIKSSLILNFGDWVEIGVIWQEV